MKLIRQGTIGNAPFCSEVRWHCWSLRAYLVLLLVVSGELTTARMILENRGTKHPGTKVPGLLVYQAF
jgi:hypothetical protein